MARRQLIETSFADRPEADWDWTLELGQVIHEFARLQSMLTDRWMKPLGITRAQGFILVFLAWHHGATQTELADLLEVSRVASGVLVRRLMERKMVEVLADPKDKRASRVVLTPLGRKIVEKFRASGREFNKIGMASIDEKYGRELIALFTRLKESYSDIKQIIPDKDLRYKLESE